MDLKLEYVFTLMGQEISNSKLWEFADNDLIEKESLFEDADGNILVWTGGSFQVYDTELDLNEKYVGLCKGDNWRYVGVDE